MTMLVGVDIGSYSIKLIELQERKNRLELLKFAMNTISGEDIKGSLKDLLSFAKLSSKRVSISLSGPSVIVRYIEMPFMKKEELRSAIKFEGEKYVPFDTKEAILDCAMLDKGSSGNTNRILLVAAKKDKVNNCIELFKEMGLDIACIDVDTMAIFNAFQRLGIETKQDKIYAMINIGAKFSNMNIVMKGYPYFTRDILWGGIDVSNRIKELLGLDLNEVELLKRNPCEKKLEINGVIMPALDKFISEIRMSFDYFETQFGKSVERIYLSGGTSYLFNMMDFLKESLELEVIQWNPLEGVEVMDRQFDKEIASSPARFAVAMGLALRK